MKIMITADKLRGRRGYHGAELELPADRYAMEDALQRARVPENGGYAAVPREGWPRFLNRALLDSGKKTLEELSLLAGLVSRLDEASLGAYEGMVKLRQEEDITHPVSIRELINAAYNVNSFEFHPGVLNDYDLGTICLQGEMLDLISGLLDEVYELLDEEKVGAALRRSEQGTFTPSGYVYRSSKEWQEVYDGTHLPEQPESHDGSIALRLEHVDHAPGTGESVWLELPADGAAIEQAVQSLGVASLDDCAIAEVKSIVPLLQYQIAGNEDAEKLNTLAERLQAFDRKTLVKYKAVLELEVCNDLDLELDIARNLTCYDYDTLIFSPESFAEYILREAEFDPDDPAFAGFDFKDYGERCLKESGSVPTVYGMIARNSRPFVHEYTALQLPQSGMTMH